MTRGTDSALETALRDNSADLLHYFERRTAAEEAADLLAETMVTAWRRAADLPEPTEQRRMWMFGIARNVLANAERADRRRRRLTAKLKLMLRPQDSHQGADAGAEIRDAVGRLEPETAELVRLVHWDGFSVAQAGEILGVGASTARGRYQRAKAQLRETLSESADENRPETRGHCPATLPRVRQDLFQGPAA